MRDVARPACVGLGHAFERHHAPVHEAAELADLPLHVVDALGPHLPDHLAGAREIGVEAEEVDAILEREDLRLAVQAQAQRLDVLLDPLEDLPEQQLVAADDVEVVHVTAIDEAEVIPQPVVEVVQIEQGEQLARLVADGDPGVWRAVDDDPEQPLDEVDQLLVRQEGQSLAGLLEADGVQQGVKELGKVTFQHPALGVVPLLHRPVWQAGGPPGLLVCRLPAEKVVAHGAGQTVEAVVGAFADLPRIVIPDEAPGEYGLEDIVAERVLDDFALEVYGKDEPLLGLVHLEGVVGPEGVLAPLEAVREVGRALDGLHAVAHGRGVVPLPAAGLAVCFV